MQMAEVLARMPLGRDLPRLRCWPLPPLRPKRAPQIDNGTGEFTLPKGFEYDAVASIECDAGKLIEPRMSRPDQRIKVADGLTPAEMTFIIPGPRCPLWVSH